MNALHYAIVNDFGLYAETNALCGGNFHRRKKLTDDEAAVTCGACLKLLGFEAAPETMLTEVTHDVAPDTGNQRIAA